MDMWRERVVHGKSPDRLYPSPVQITEMQINGNFYADDYKLKSDSTLYLKSNENTITFRFASFRIRKTETY